MRSPKTIAQAINCMAIGMMREGTHRKAQQKAGLADTGITDQQKLEQIIAATQTTKAQNFDEPSYQKARRPLTIRGS
jgi:hypothetical protein